jgi:hypothetical protein
VFAEERVPFNDDGLELLRRLCDERELALHGSPAAREHEKIDRGIAVLGRTLTTRLHRARG